MKNENGGLQFVLGLCLGIVGGAIATLLLTPQPGNETRRQLRDTTFREANTLRMRIASILEDEVRRLVQRIGDELLEAGRTIVEEQQAQLRARLRENRREERRPEV
jgi:gas vesicle protein